MNVRVEASKEGLAIGLATGRAGEPDITRRNDLLRHRGLHKNTVRAYAPFALDYPNLLRRRLLQQGAQLAL